MNFFTRFRRDKDVDVTILAEHAERQAGWARKPGVRHLGTRRDDMGFESIPYEIIDPLRAFASYILSRLSVAAMAEDPAHDYLEPLAELMGVPLEIRTAKTRVHEVFPPRLATGIERLLTGEPWTEAESGPRSSGMM